MKDELALLKAARKLDQEALIAIFDAYAPALYSYLLHICHDPIESDQVVGDVFAKLLEQFAAGQGPLTGLKAYLFKMAYRSVVDGVPRNHRSAPLETVIDTPKQRKRESVRAQLDERDLLGDFRAILNNELSEIERHVIILRYIEGFSLRETVEIVGKKVNHVKVIQHRSVARLRKSLEGHLWTTGVSRALFVPRNGD